MILCFLRRAILLLGGFLASVAFAQAQTYPDKPIHLVVQYAAGGASDAIARNLGDRLSKRLGQPVVVENKPGGNGVIATQYVARARPDGYTLYLTLTTPYSMLASMYRRPLGYDPEKDYTAIARVAEYQTGLFAHPGKNLNTVSALVAHAKANPGKLSYSSTGTGQVGTLAAELLKMKLGIDILQVPYPGAGPAYQALVAGQVDVTLLDVGTAVPFVKSNKLLALAVVGNARSHLLPNVPTLKEAGVDVDIPMIWTGIVGPGGMPPAIVAKLNTEISEVVKDPSTQEFLRNLALTPSTSTPQELDQQIKSDRQQWGAVIKTLGIQLE